LWKKVFMSAERPLTENTSLELHVELCAERYKRLQEKITSVEDRLDQIHDDFASFKNENQKNLSEIKTMLSNAKDEKFKIMVTSTATVIVGLLAMLGYVITHLSK
jgi:predicted  nucleic acid-binding Zn-ribbon protein